MGSEGFDCNRNPTKLADQQIKTLLSAIHLLVQLEDEFTTRQRACLNCYSWKDCPSAISTRNRARDSNVITSTVTTVYWIRKNCVPLSHCFRNHDHDLSLQMRSAHAGEFKFISWIVVHENLYAGQAFHFFIIAGNEDSAHINKVWQLRSLVHDHISSFRWEFEWLFQPHQPGQLQMYKGHLLRHGSLSLAEPQMIKLAKRIILSTVLGRKSMVKIHLALHEELWKKFEYVSQDVFMSSCLHHPWLRLASFWRKARTLT